MKIVGPRPDVSPKKDRSIMSSEVRANRVEGRKDTVKKLKGSLMSTS